MDTKLLKASDSAIDTAAKLLQNGELVAIPTETVYGLAANALDENAVKSIFTAKGRPQDNPLIVHIADLSSLELLCEDIPEDCYKLAEKFWPGPLTIIMKKSKLVPNVTSGGLDTVAVRMPCHAVAKDIILKSNCTLAAPSANLSGSPSPTTARHVFEDMNGRIPLIVDGGDSEFGVESTVITLCGIPTLLRPGCVTHEELEETLGKKVEISKAVVNKLEKGEKVSSPGMKYKHYSPKAEVYIIKGDRKEYCEYLKEKPSAWALCFDEDIEFLENNYISYGRERDFDAQAHSLFTALRNLDEKGASVVYAHCPEENGVALAVYNRLLRAAAFRVIKL